MQFRHQTWLSKLMLGLAVAALLIPAARAAEATTPTTDEPEVMFSINIKQVLDSPVVKKYACWSTSRASSKWTRSSRKL